MNEVFVQPMNDRARPFSKVMLMLSVATKPLYATTDKTQTSHTADTKALNTHAAKTKRSRTVNKTSIRNIDPDTLWDAKIYAAKTKQTMGKIVTEALQRLLYEEAEEEVTAC
ncbi:hypothetical protein [Halocynthiibacter styelae]|uniref:Uncharacterized protein n=1 Tax=Halocynthiibacter styelae TaxID=2761955 RepID=A0A8J7IDV9_9RHOB|nr:hypothetical protein [Paenihalocynthiibacter styelae]MBI1494818.1 hypothetical protein [Paenihalocynthiibacter styelae]